MKKQKSLYAFSNSKTDWLNIWVGERQICVKSFNKDFKNPPEVGINKSPIFQLVVSKPGGWEKSKKDLSFQSDYFYDQGLKLDNLPSGILNTILQKVSSELKFSIAA